MRFCSLLFTLTLFFIPQSILAHPEQEESIPLDLDTLPLVEVVGSRDNSLIGDAQTASQGEVGEEIFRSRPLLRPGELIEVVPGMIATQHSGTGKANQYFFRGFNLDHGTDFRTQVEGMPVNIVSHGHGQGYTDLNFLIPEMVQHVSYFKGPYFAEFGDFSNAGSARFNLKNRLDRNFSTLTIGEFDYFRGLGGAGFTTNNGQGVGAIEILNYDGPWEVEENSRKVNGYFRYSWKDTIDTFSVTGMAYRGIWDATDQVPLRAIENGTLGRFGSADSTTGGNSNRFSASATWDRAGKSGDYHSDVYAIYYDLDLYSNFTYFLDDTVNGDQFLQEDRRVILGGELSASHDYSLASMPSTVRYGTQLRYDHIPEVALRRTSQRQVVSTVRDDEVDEATLGLFVENTTKVNSWFKTILGLRGDFIYADVDSDTPQNSGNEDDAQVSPKVGFVFGPWEDTEFYVNGGYSFHSNDARGATARVDPESGDILNPVDLYTEAKGAETGVRTAIIPGLVSTLSVWYLELQNELVFVGDAGNTEVLGSSERYGVEFSNFIRPNDWLFLYTDYAYVHPRFKDDSSGEDRIPNSIEHTLVSGFRLGYKDGFYTSGKHRYLGTRDLIEDGSAKAPVVSLVDLRLGYIMDNVEFALDVFNVLDEDDFDIAYFYESQLASEAMSAEGLHVHPVEPRLVRATMTYRF